MRTPLAASNYAKLLLKMLPAQVADIASPDYSERVHAVQACSMQLLEMSTFRLGIVYVYVIFP